MVFSGLVTACRLATWPTSRSPPFVTATIEGVKRDPSLLSSTVGSPASMTATAEFVVPRSMPITLAITLEPPLSSMLDTTGELTHLPHIHFTIVFRSYILHFMLV